MVSFSSKNCVALRLDSSLKGQMICSLGRNFQSEDDGVVKRLSRSAASAGQGFRDIIAMLRGSCCRRWELDQSVIQYSQGRRVQFRGYAGHSKCLIVMLPN